MAGSLHDDVERAPLLSRPPAPAPSSHDAEEVQAEGIHTDLHRGLGQRHLAMLGIAGSIGTGLFLGLGAAVLRAGPLGALLGYATIGVLVCAVQLALAEAAALWPLPGGFVAHADLLVDPAWGMALGWNLVYGNVLSIPGEITAMCVLFRFWGWAEHLSPAVLIVVFIAVTLAIGMARVSVFGEVEYAFAWLKVALVIGLILLGLAIDVGAVPGTEALGFRYWREPGPFVDFIAQGGWGRFLGYWSVMTGAVFSFAGTESIAMAAAETRNPQKAIPAACKGVFLRIFIFYMLAVFVVGLLVPSNDARLNDTPTSTAQSPFVIAASAAGIPLIPSIVNSVVITSAWSASNQSLLAGTRVLYGLAARGHAPKVFLRTTSWGAPWVCVAFFGVFMTLSFMSLSEGALTVFWWLVSLTSAGVLISWSAILWNHLTLRRALDAQQIPVSRLPWHNKWTVYTSKLGLVMSITILLTSGFTVFTRGNWDPNQFVSSYLDIPLVLSVFLAWKYVKKTRSVSLKEIPIMEALNKTYQDA